MRTTTFIGTGALVLSTLALGTMGLAGPALAATGPVSRTPAAGTPQLASTGTTEQVRQIVKCGGTMYAVGSFSAISWNGHTYRRHGAFSFAATPPYKMTSWGPNVGGKVNSIALNARCTTAYLGGAFSSVNQKAAQNLAAVNATTGSLITGFGRSANGQVETLLRTRGHLFAGGYYTKINGSSSNRYMTSLNTASGKNDGFIRLNISGHYQFPGVHENATRVYNQQLSHGGTLELVEGDFTSVGGQARQQVFMLNVGGSRASVTGWTGRGLNTNCTFSEPFYAQAAAWSPDDSTIYVGTTGYKPAGTPGGSAPRTGPCDAAIAYPSTPHVKASRKWINYTGCDSLYSTAADTSTAYFGGHERWSQNPGGCDFAGPGAISAPGMEGLSPGNGALTFNPTRGRGLGADDMLITSAGLWIASDNLNGTNQCGGVSQHAGICLLPYG